jgi:hypothetical protein
MTLKGLATTLLLALLAPSALALQVLEASVERSTAQGPVVIRGLYDPAPQPNGKLLMVFPGWPGIPRIELREGRPAWLFRQHHVEELKHLLHQAGISLMTVDCPTDQWGVRGPTPTACDDAYRSSLQHAQDVRALIALTRQVTPMQSFFIMGHSYGAISSHWLAMHLGDELAGSLHSASRSVESGGTFAHYGHSIAGLDASRLPRHSIYLHHRDDLCRFTPYAYAKRQAIHGLMTVVGGNRWSDPCGKASYHSYAGRSSQVGAALVRWMNEGVITPLIKGEQD